MAKKENEFTSIEISKKDRQRLFELSMKIRGLNNNKESFILWKYTQRKRGVF